MMTESRMQSSDTPAWHVAFCHPSREFRARHELLRQGYGVFLPYYLSTEPMRANRLARTQRTPHRRRLIGVSRPYFPSYLFVAASPGQPLDPISSTVGVVDLLRNAWNKALTVPAAVIDEIRSRCDPGTERIRMTAAERTEWVRVGMQVRLDEGPLAAFAGLVRAIDQLGRLTVDVEIFGRPVPVQMPADQVRPMEVV